MASELDDNLMAHIRKHPIGLHLDIFCDIARSKIQSAGIHPSAPDALDRLEAKGKKDIGQLSPSARFAANHHIQI